MVIVLKIISKNISKIPNKDSNLSPARWPEMYSEQSDHFSRSYYEVQMHIFCESCICKTIKLLNCWNCFYKLKFFLSILLAQGALQSLLNQSHKYFPTIIAKCRRHISIHLKDVQAGGPLVSLNANNFHYTSIVLNFKKFKLLTNKEKNIGASTTTIIGPYEQQFKPYDNIPHAKTFWVKIQFLHLFDIYNNFHLSIVTWSKFLNKVKS